MQKEPALGLALLEIQKDVDQEFLLLAKPILCTGPGNTASLGCEAFFKDDSRCKNLTEIMTSAGKCFRLMGFDQAKYFVANQSEWEELKSTIVLESHPR
ncbi:hypothetical protein ANCCEY_10246 [Ancylostoma ceylanicum]|uniref:Uncharacterized protein n=1 Tax=Ancylostoma ceylanicum TaxID=53326 RepID=A0A0D6LHL1_9BILA|nr:hypothetical protein ANCCEY_10246 [Ancylostoma ceylanicum]